MSDLFEYIAVALIEAADNLNGRISVPRAELADILNNEFDLVVEEATLSNAIRLLNMCNISYAADDPFAGHFVVITQQKFKDFINNVTSDQQEYSRLLNDAFDEHEGLNRAENTKLPYLELYHKHKPLRNYIQFGGDWIRAALKRIQQAQIEPSASGTQSAAEAPASDRVVTFADNEPEIENIRSSLGQLAHDIRLANDVGGLSADERQVAAEEVEQLRSALSGVMVRVSTIRQMAKQSLGWIISKAGEAAIGAVATAILAAIAAYFGFSV